MTSAQDGTRDTQTPTWEVGLATGRTKFPGPDLLLHELERAAEKLEGGELQALEKERPGVRSHHRRKTRMLTKVGLASQLSCQTGKETGTQSSRTQHFSPPTVFVCVRVPFSSKFLKGC